MQADNAHYIYLVPYIEGSCIDKLKPLSGPWLSYLWIKWEISSSYCLISRVQKMKLSNNRITLLLLQKGGGSYTRQI